MDVVEKELLRGEVDALVAAVEEARFRHVAGMDAAPSLADAFRAHGRAAHRDSVKALEADGEKDLAALVAALRAERVQAADEEAWRTAEATASAIGPDGVIDLEAAQLAVVNERDRGRRLAFGRAVAEAAALASREAAAEKRARARAEVGLTPDWESVVEADAVLALSDDGYRDVLRWMARREAQVTPAPQGDATRADLLYVLALHGYDALFPAGMLALALEQALAPLRLDARRLRVDDGKRPAQWPGAHAHGARVSLRRQGGVADWLGLFDAVGQALGALHAPPHRRDPRAPYAVGALLAGLLLDRGFLVSRIGVDRKHAGDLVRALALRQLFRLRARCAAFRVASEVERGTSGAAWHDAYREAMTLAAAATWPPGLAARDADASASAAILKGAARAERLRRSFVERFDEDWWKNPRAADALGTALAGGVGEPEEPPLALAAEALLARMQ
jgi:hypothetical protein